MENPSVSKHYAAGLFRKILSEAEALSTVSSKLNTTSGQNPGYKSTPSAIFPNFTPRASDTSGNVCGFCRPDSGFQS